MEGNGVEVKEKMKKLRGYEFYKAIGSPKRVVAPMVDQSELAFRMLCREHGADLCYTPMFHSRLFVESPEYREKMFEKHIHDRPLVVQFCGNDPETVLNAARYVEGHCDAVDLNLGCPQGIARKGRYGAFLMKEKQTVKEIVSTLADNLTIPVTVKIRIFPDLQETLSFCDMLQEAGADLLTVHGRTKEMNKTAVRECDWDIIRQIKQRLDIPVFANGGIETPEDIEACLKVTQADGVMSSEALLENPALFREDKASLPPIELAAQYLEFAKLHPPSSLKIVRAHLFKILHQDLRIFQDIRVQLAEQVDTMERMEQVIQDVKTRLEDPSHGHGVFEYGVETSWYRRHRAGQRKVRRPSEDEYEQAMETGYGRLFG